MLRTMLTKGATRDELHGWCGSLQACSRKIVPGWQFWMDDAGMDGVKLPSCAAEKRRERIPSLLLTARTESQDLVEGWTRRRRY